MGCVQCKDKEATKLTDERDGSLTQSSGYRYGTDPTPQHYPSFGVTSIPNYNNFHATGGQGLTVFGGVNSSSHTGTLRTRGGTGEFQSLLSASINHKITIEAPLSQPPAFGKIYFIKYCKELKKEWSWVFSPAFANSQVLVHLWVEKLCVYYVPTLADRLPHPFTREQEVWFEPLHIVKGKYLG